MRSFLRRKLTFNREKYILPEDYYKVFLLDGTAIQVQDLINIISETIYKEENNTSNRYYVLFNFWIRAFEYIYRCLIKNRGVDAIQDLNKAVSELTLLKDKLKEYNCNLFLDSIVHPEMCKLLSKINTPEEIQYNKYKRPTQSYILPTQIADMIEYKARWEYIENKYNLKIKDNIKQKFEVLIGMFLNASSLKEIEQVIYALQLIIKKKNFI